MAWPLATMMRVYPSGDAFAAASAAMVPPAPGRLSMMIFVGHRLPSSSARVRATISTAPPGGNGTRRCTGRDGKLSWACSAGLSATSARAASPAVAKPRLIEALIGLLPSGLSAIEIRTGWHAQAKLAGGTLRQLAARLSARDLSAEICFARPRTPQIDMQQQAA